MIRAPERVALSGARLWEVERIATYRRSGNSFFIVCFGK